MASPLNVYTPLLLKNSQKRDGAGGERGGKGRKGGRKKRGWGREGKKGTVGALIPSNGGAIF